MPWQTEKWTGCPLFSKFSFILCLLYHIPISIAILRIDSRKMLLKRVHFTQMKMLLSEVSELPHRHLELRLPVRGLERWPGCHPERSEGSLRPSSPTVRGFYLSRSECAQERLSHNRASIQRDCWCHARTVLPPGVPVFRCRLQRWLHSCRRSLANYSSRALSSIRAWPMPLVVLEPSPE